MFATCTIWTTRNLNNQNNQTVFYEPPQISMFLFSFLIHFRDRPLKNHIEIVGFGIGADGEVTLRCRYRNMAEPTGNVLNSLAVVHENGGEGMTQDVGMTPLFGDYLAERLRNDDAHHPITQTKAINGYEKGRLLHLHGCVAYLHIFTENSLQA